MATKTSKQHLAFSLYILVSCFLAVGIAAQDSTSRDSTSRSLEVLESGVVMVKTAAGRVGTGFIIHVGENRAHVLTAYHVIEGQPARAIEVYFHRDPFTGMSVRQIRNQTEAEDLSILVVDVDNTRGLKPLVFKRSLELDTSNPAHVIGFYGGTTGAWVVTEARLIDQRDSSIRFAGAIEEGNSGSPLVQGGEVIGIVTRQGPGHHFATPGILAQYFINGVLGALPVACDAPLIPAASCEDHILIDRASCDRIEEANQLYTAGAYDAAITAYDAAIAAGFSEAVLFNNRGAVKLTKRDFEGASADFERALEHDPDYIPALANQSFAKTFLFYEQTLDMVRSEGKSPNPLLDLLGSVESEDEGPRNEAAESRDPPAGLETIAEGLTQVLSALMAPQVDAMKMEALQERFLSGRMSCYGGDILAANDELNLGRAGELMEFFGQER